MASNFLAAQMKLADAKSIARKAHEEKKIDRDGEDTERHLSMVDHILRSAQGRIEVYKAALQ